MSPDHYAGWVATGGWINLTDGVRLTLTGPDRVRYLNGQVTADVRKLSCDTASRACVTNHKGRLEAIIRISDSSEALCIDGDASQRDFLPPRLGKYLIADGAILTDVSESTALLHFTNPASLTNAVIDNNERMIRANRIGYDGVDVWISRNRLDYWKSQAEELPWEFVEATRLEHRIAVWDHELTTDTLPPEARLDDDAISYDKGCYIGQEVISRMKTAGKVNLLLHGFSLTSSAEPGTRLLTKEGTDVGHLTSVAMHPLLSWLALGYLKRSAGDGPWSCGGTNLAHRRPQH